MTHREAAACDSRGGDNLKIVLGLEVADFQLAQADNGERRRLDPADAITREPLARAMFSSRSG